MRTVDRPAAAPPPPPPPDITPLVSALGQSLRTMEQQIAAAFEEIESSCLEFAFGVVEQITNEQVDRGHYNLDAALKDLLDQHRQLIAQANVQVRVHPEDYEDIKAWSSEQQDFTLELISDPTSRIGSLKLEWGATSILRSFAIELAQFRAQLPKASST